jgi:CheY-like chemotaxis protein
VLTAGNVLPPVWFIDLRPRAGYLRDIPLVLEEFLLARKILLADDSVTAQNMGRKILADAGYEVIAVNNGSAALKKIAELKPDLVILDVYMPGYSGLEVCQRLKESQETARIPVLLTVGKLEPFKPEEAQRVRAEGYIVKPFEASELLSALSKLEDKVVPRAEPSKPGRFARAMAAAEETDRGGQKEPSSTETGWKNRIAFPLKKTEAEEASDEESTSGNGTKKFAANQEKHQEPSLLEGRVDVAAFAPIGVPKDVTPAEVAAITAAAARMQMAESSARDGDRSSESAGSEMTREFPVAPSLERFQDSRSDETHRNAGPESINAVAPSNEIPTAELDPGRNGDSLKNDLKLSDDKLSDEKSDDAQGAPVTMAAASESLATVSAGASRWTAVAVPLENDEASISLDHEMQKAYAAFAVADHATSAGTVEAEPTPPEFSAAQPEATGEIQGAATSVDAIATSTEEPVVAVSNSALAAVPEFESVPAVANPETAQTPDLAKPDENGAPSEAAPVIAENSEPKPDSETVKTSAAAWANWRQIRDTVSSTEKSQPQPEELVPSEAASTDTAALAVAAGAEQALQEASSAEPNRSSEDVASIVDSVLAGLRPKLMEEITRKMAEKK